MRKKLVFSDFGLQSVRSKVETKMGRNWVKQSTVVILTAALATLVSDQAQARTTIYVRTYQNKLGTPLSGKTIAHTFTAVKKASKDFVNGKTQRIKEAKWTGGDMTSVSAHNLMPSPNVVEGLPGGVTKDNYVDSIVGGSDVSISTSNPSKRICRGEFVKDQEESAWNRDNYLSTCFFIYGLQGVCHNYSARMQKAVADSDLPFDNINVGTYNGKLSYQVYGQYGLDGNSSKRTLTKEDLQFSDKDLKAVGLWFYGLKTVDDAVKAANELNAIQKKASSVVNMVWSWTNCKAAMNTFCW